MYAPFFGLQQEPFSIAPDPRYLYMSERHREALAHLLYGLGGGGGFVLLTGEIGAGKTTVCRCFLEQIPRRCNVAYIFNPKLTVEELLKTVCDEFNIPYAHQGPGAATVKDYLDPLNEFLLRTHAVGQNNVLIIDEAQMLSAEVLEQLRLLTNLETNERKLLQIVLIGQPELRTLLARPELEQLAQRVIARFHLEALSEAETTQYIGHRLAVAGMSRAMPFDAAALRRIHQLSRGVPRRINLVCDRALLGAYASGKPAVGRAIVDKAAGEVFDRGESAPAGAWSRGRRSAAIGLGALGGAALAALIAVGLNGGWRETARAAAPAAMASAPRPAASGASAAVSAAAAAPSTPVPASAASAALATAPAASAAAAPIEAPIRSEREAWRELASAWKLRLGDGDPCQVAQRQQLQCFKGSGGLSLIRLLGRPGILTLYDENDKTGYALLTGLTEQNATLRMGGAAQTVTLSSLSRIWRGDFATYWRAPAGYSAMVGPGAVGPVVDQLATQLARFDQAPKPADGTAYDDALKVRLQAFQVARGLKPDGIAGPTTFMQLNRATGVDEPRLDGGS